MRWPSDRELASKTTTELRAEFSHLGVQQIHNRRGRRGIKLTAAAQARADRERGEGRRRAGGRLDRDTSRSETREAIARLEAQGFRITKLLPHEPIVNLPMKPGTVYRCAVVCCTHLGNVAQQITHLHDFYRYAQSKGYEEFWNAGDTTDGPDTMHRDAVHEHWRHTMDEVVEYWVKAYPKVRNGLTRLILGNHDEAWLKDGSGSNIGMRLAALRPDVKYVGRRSARVRVGPVKVDIWHGSGAGSYARSYKMQKKIEAYQPEDRPDLLLAGNWHVPAHIPSYIGTEGFMLPSFEHTTPFIASHGKESVVGGLMLELELGQRGLRDVRVEWRIYDKPIRGDHPK